MEIEFNYEENRFSELKNIIGSIQSEGIYPSVVGFRRPLFHILLKLLLPMLFSAILVFEDNVWMSVPSLVVIIFAYFSLQLALVKAGNFKTEMMNFVLFIIVGYISAILLVEQNALARNYLGWFYIIFLGIYITITSIGQLQKVIKMLKQNLMGNE